MDAMSAAHDAQYASLNNGAWFCLTAVMLGAAAGLGWMWIGGGAL